jgi:hypothetical protein
MARWSDKPKPYRPPDAAEIERFLDYVAGLMVRNQVRQHLMLPIWRALERELRKAREEEAVFAAARDRAARASLMSDDPRRHA